MRLTDTIFLIGPCMALSINDIHLNESAHHTMAGRGIDVVNPLELIGPDHTKEESTKILLEAMSGCDGVAMIPGWESDPVATVLAIVATATGIEICKISIT
jgi:hypothetical protein